VGKREAAGVLDGEPGDLGVFLGRAIVRNAGPLFMGGADPVGSPGSFLERRTPVIVKNHPLRPRTRRAQVRVLSNAPQNSCKYTFLPLEDHLIAGLHHQLTTFPSPNGLAKRR
jgi:hypothetical protein